jgi:hypothetical protein
MGGMVNRYSQMEKVAHYANLDYKLGRPEASTYSFTGPTSGANGVASTAFTVSIKDGESTLPVVVTPSESGTGNQGTFNPTSVRLTNESRSATFQFTPGSTGSKVISLSNSVENQPTGLTNPTSITYVSS